MVLIIGILAAVALPKYQTAVQKSRYATLMPLDKSVKDAEEAAIMANGSYTMAMADLSVNIPGGDASFVGGSWDFNFSDVVEMNAPDSGEEKRGYDENGNLMFERFCPDDNMDECASGNVSGGTGRDYQYDENGNMTAHRYCGAFASDFSCSEYSAAGDSEYGWGADISYEYDEDGNITVEHNRTCSGLNNDNSCSGYSDGFDVVYEEPHTITYEGVDCDEDGHEFPSTLTQTFSNVKTIGSCGSLNSSGNCDSYDSMVMYANDSDYWQYHDKESVEGGAQLGRNCLSVEGKTCTSWGEWETIW